MKEECSKQGQARANALWQDGLGQPTREKGTESLDLREKEGMRLERQQKTNFFCLMSNKTGSGVYCKIISHWSNFE